MFRFMCKGKIHRATIKEANLNYVGSITVDRDLLEAAGLLPYEKVQVVDCNNGARLETYVIPGARGSGQICLNGAAARLVQVGDVIIIISYGMFSDAEAQALRPKLVFVDGENRIAEVVEEEAAGTLSPSFEMA